MDVSWDVSCLSIEIGFFADKLSDEATEHERKKSFKLFVSEEIRSFIPRKFLVFWQHIAPVACAPYPEVKINPGGVIEDEDLGAWANAQLALIGTSPALTVDAKEIQHRCTETPTGNWRKSRAMPMFAGDKAWRPDASIDAYSNWLAQPLPANLVAELKTLRFIAAIEWEVKHGVESEPTFELIPTAFQKEKKGRARAGTN